MGTEIIQQKITVKDWPLTKPKTEKFFGYVVAMGVFPHDWGESVTQYVDFAYNERYERYRLPQHESLKMQLYEVLWDNLNGQAHTGDIYGKVYVSLLDNGDYSVATS